MKKLQITATVMILMIFAAVSAFGEDAGKAPSGSKKVELHNQTVCPVMGGKIDSTYYTDIQGQRVYHCCPACSDKLKKDPDKYFEEAAAQGVLFENIQTTCPVTGEKLEKKDVFVDYEGRRVYFCCSACVKNFEKDPQKYLGLMDHPSVPGDKKNDKMENMKMDDDHATNHNM